MRCSAPFDQRMADRHETFVTNRGIGEY